MDMEPTRIIHIGLPLLQRPAHVNDLLGPDRSIALSVPTTGQGWDGIVGVPWFRVCLICMMQTQYVV